MSASGEGKATFGFQLVCDDDRVSGQLQYNDHNFVLEDTKVKFHGVVDPAAIVCNGETNEGIFSGTYTPQPKKAGPAGIFIVQVEDNGEPGPSMGDSFEIMLTGGIFDGYINGGPLEGGNIQVWE